MITSVTELSEVQQQLTEINNRYSLLGVRLLDRQSELESIKEELRKHLEHLKSLSQFLDKIQRLLPKESIPQTKEDADKMVKNIKVVITYILLCKLTFIEWKLRISVGISSQT